MKKILKIQKFVPYILTTLFFLYLCLQFTSVMVYCDDYGYYSLSYGVHTTFKGHNYTLIQLFSFLREHYFHANGRLLYFFIWLFIYHIGELKLVQLAAAAIVTLIFFSIFKIILHYNDYARNHTALLSVMCFMSYGIMEISILRFGMYWFVAMFLYVASLLPFLLFQIIYLKKANTTSTNILLIILIFMSSWSQESWSVSTVCFTLFLAVYEWKMNNLSKWNICYIFAAAIGFGLLISSPGIQQRATGYETFYTFNVLEKVKYCLPNIMLLFNKMRLFQLILWGSQIILSISLAKNEKKKFVKLWDYFYIICILLKLLSYFLIYQKTEIENASFYIQLSNIFTCYLISCMIVQVTRYYISEEKIIPLLVFFSTVISIGCLLVVPEIPDRLFIPLAILSNILNLDIIMNYLSGVKYNLAVRILVFSIFMVLCLPNMFHIYRAYANNAKIWNANKIKIEEAAVMRAQTTDGNDYVILQKLPHFEYAGEMLYSGVADFMKIWMCNYYNLPYEFEFIYQDM